MAERDDWIREPTDIRGTRWIGFAAIIAIVAILMRQPLLLILAVVLALTAALARLWWRFGLSQVTYRREFSQSPVEFGEEINLELVTDNAKPLPLVWLDIKDEWPIAVEVLGAELDPASKPKVRIFRTFFSIRPYERVRRRYRLRCGKRGYHSFGPATLTTGDPFGFVAREQGMKRVDYLTVYPEVLSMPALGLPARQPLGDLHPVQPLVEDPLRVEGVRPYVAGDSPRRIHWRATARTGVMQVKRYERTASPTVALFVDTNTFEFFWEGQTTALLELTISTAASLAAHLLSTGEQVGLYVNAPTPGSGGRFVRIAPSRHPAQLAQILRNLALVITGTGNRIEASLAAESARLPWGAIVVIITARVTDAMQASLIQHARGNRRLALVICGSRPSLSPELQRRVTVRYVNREEVGDAADRLAVAN